MEITAPQRENMLHALGCSEQSVPYRNFFWTDADSEDGLTWAPLVEAGLAWKSGPKAGFGGMCMYAVTDDGIAAQDMQAISVRPYPFPENWTEDVKACPECQRYSGHPIQQGICDTHRRPLWARDEHDKDEWRRLDGRKLDIAREALRLIASVPQS